MVTDLGEERRHLPKTPEASLGDEALLKNEENFEKRQPAADSSNVFSESGREIECFTMFLFVVERRERERERQSWRERESSRKGDRKNEGAQASEIARGAG